jgi:hypothetical protein
MLYPSSTWENDFFPILNVMILQMVRNGCVRFGGHIVDIQKYKLATRSYSWKYQSRPEFCTICLAFKKGYFEAILDSTQAHVFRSEHFLFAHPWK